MNVSGVYLLQRAGWRIWQFIWHWYVDAFIRGFRWHVNFLEGLDRFFALRITLRYFFQPLYQDYTFVGRILGIILRSIRITGAVLTYTIVALVSIALYIGWAAVPLYIIYRIILNA